MPKFRVSVTETVTTTYASVIVEADSKENAFSLAVEKALIGELDENNSYSNWINDAEEVA